MALPSSKEEFKEYCLRKLGKGAIDINVTDAQIEDRIDEALEHFFEYHDEGTERVFIKHEVTQTEMENEFIQMPDNVIGVSGFLPDRKRISSFFDIEYQFMQENVHDIANSELRYFYIAQKHLSLIEQMFDYLTPIRYNRVSNKVYIDQDWRKFRVGEFLVFDTFKVIDVEQFNRVWQNKWLRDYTTSLIKLQWGQNLSKYEGVQVIGGISFNGTRFIDEANNEIERLEQQLKETETAPLGIFIG